MITLFVREQGAAVRRISQRLQVVKGQQVLETVRLREVERVVLFGHVELSAPAMIALLDQGIETVLLSAGGKFRGRLAPADGRNVFLRRAQFQRYDDIAFRLRMACAILQAKARNGRYLLQRHAWNHADAELEAHIAKLERVRTKLETQTTLETLLGVEGECARVYFGAFGKMVRSEFAFTTRTRRPPRDPMNALLSFGYTLLSTEITGALAAQGLDPYVGLLHDLDYGRPSLALDVLEEFRQPVIDRLALSLVNRGVLKIEDFDDRKDAGVFLNDQGRPRFLEYYYRALETPFTERGADAPTTFRALMQRQAGRIRASIVENTDYTPYLAG